MKDRPIAAAGELKAKPINELESLPEDSIGGVYPQPPPPPLAPHRKKSAVLDRTIRVNTAAARTVSGKSSLSSNRTGKILLWIVIACTLLCGVVVSTVLVVHKQKEEKRREKEILRRTRSIRLRHEIQRRNIPLPPGECPPEMVWISTGDSQKGFCIDVYEFPNKKSAIPVNVTVSEDAEKLCSKVGKRLCTKKEWIKACRGQKNFLYPYGEMYNPTKCVTKPGSSEAPPVQRSGSWTECRTDTGIYDMSGNMAEWVEEGTLMGGSGALSGESTSCIAEGGGGEPTYYGTRCCISPAIQH